MQPFELVGTTFQAEAGVFRVTRYLGKGKSGYSYLMENGHNRYVLKKMHDEPCPYYQFGESKTKAEIHAYETLSAVGLKVPDLVEYHLDAEFLIKEFIDGQTGAHYIADREVPDRVIQQLFEMANLLREHDLNIDYFPTNFVVRDDEVFYIDYEFNRYDPAWSLENWGLYYWANSDGMRTYLVSGDPLAINQRTDSGIPIKTPFVEKVQAWIEKYSTIAADALN